MASGKGALVPSLWILEMANGLLMAERRGKLTAAEVDHGLSRVEAVIAAGKAKEKGGVPASLEGRVPASGGHLKEDEVGGFVFELRAGCAVWPQEEHCRGDAAG